MYMCKLVTIPFILLNEYPFVGTCVRFVRCFLLFEVLMED